MPGVRVWLLTLALAGCAGPDVVGQRVGQSLYDASVNTGRAIAVVGDRVGYGLQNAGANLRNAVNPPPIVDAAPLELQPPYAPDDFTSRPPVTTEPLSPAY